MSNFTFDLQHISPKIPAKVKKFDPSYLTRYVIVAELIKQVEKKLNRPLKILDLGGYNGAARDLLPGRDITILDVAEDNTLTNYVKVDGPNIPFSDGFFDIVISCDTLEHIPSSERTKFINEALRASGSYVFLGAPFGSNEVIQAERDSDVFYQGMAGQSYIWLKEHAEYELPQKTWMNELLKNYKVNFTSFDHTSLNVWGVMLRFNFFLADNIRPVNALIAKKLSSANDAYIRDYTFNDFPEEGYRSFYIVSKTDPVNVKLPPYDKNKNRAFMDKLYLLAGESIQSFTKEHGILESQLVDLQGESQILYADNKQLHARNSELEKRLSALMNSKSYKLAVKLAKSKQLLTRKPRASN